MSEQGIYYAMMGPSHLKWLKSKKVLEPKKPIAYSEFLKNKGCSDCKGCLDTLVEFVKTEVPSNFNDLESLGIPQSLLAQYYDKLSKGIIGERSDRI